MNTEVVWLRGCDSSSCTEAARDGKRIRLRNSDWPEYEISFSLEEWREFTDGIVLGKFASLEVGP